MVLGTVVGLLLSPTGAALVPEELADPIADWIALPGEIFLALIQLVVVLLVISSIVLGIASGGNLTFLKKVGLRIGPYFVATTVVAVIIGVVVATTIRPGDYVDPLLVEQSLGEPGGSVLTRPVMDDVSIPERVLSVLPESPLGAVLDRAMLQIVVLAILLAIALLSIGEERAKPLLDLLGTIQAVSLEVVAWAMRLAPFAVFGLIAQICIKIGVDAVLGMSAYVGAVLLGLALLMVFYLGIVLLIGRRSPWSFLAAARDAQLLAFSTSSSAAVMPISMQTAEEKLGVRRSIAQFIVPLGATVNMDGTALYQVIAAIFLTQVFGIELSSGELVLLIATTVGASIGSPSTPGVGIVILATILAEFGVPGAGIALILGVDRILDMSRTVLNVTGDLAACVVMDRWIGADLDEESPDEPVAVSA